MKMITRAPLGAWGAFASLLGICWLVYQLMLSGHGLSPLLVVAVVALAMGFGYLVSNLRIKSDLDVLGRGIRRAKEAIFKKPIRESTGLMVAPPVREFNEMLKILDESFLEIEKFHTLMLAEKSKLKTIVESLSDGLICLDMNLQLCFYNSAAKSYFNLTDKTMGSGIDEILNMNGKDLQYLVQSIKERRTIGNYECELYLTKSSPMFMSVNLRFLHDVDERLKECIITFRDITEKRRVQERFCHNEKLVAIGQLAAGLAHELNNPLGNILGYTRMIQSRIDWDENSKAKLGIICEETKKCSRIIQQLLKLARKDQLLLRKRSLNDVVDYVLINMECKFKEGKTKLDADLSSNLPEIPFDGQQFEQAIINVLVNSLQALSLTDENNRRMKIWTEELGNEMAVYVCDNGPGVPVEVADHIFEPFFTTKTSSGGTGLGLSISATIMEKHGGSLELLSAENGYNTCFRLTLPYHRETVELHD